LPFVRSHGIDIYYELHGEGERLLLIGGLANDLTQLKGMVDGLSRNFQVIAFDSRGVGRTDKPDEPYSIEIMAEDAAGLIQALGIQSVNVIGISMGGRIAISLTLDHPELVKSLVLASTSARMNYKRGLLWSLSNFLVRIPAVRKMGTKYPQPYYAYVRQREASMNYDTSRRLGEIHLPTLILHGKKDRIVPLSLAEEIQTNIAGSRLVTVDGGHMFPFRKQNEFIGLVTEFLRTRTAGPPD
jgi:3-oxoadipate enol-lactonase